MSTHPAVSEPPSPDRPPAHRGPALGEWAVTAGLLAIGIVVLLDGLGQAASTSASGVGAGFMPKVVGVLLIVLSLALGVQVARGRRGEADTAEGDVDVRSTKWVPLAVCVAAALIFIAGVDTLGYVIVSSLAFWLTAWALGARSHLTSAVIAVVLSLVVYLAFTRALGISLAAGVLEGVL
ncbi:tripartite tricarboxylate transporter TctB family protein [Streptomyces sp. SID4919]|uniref:tripartite tricarboxylate transporter TctB family protein n=1 Tax=unclassified Streptomyces TaxID=2593676 RepID=UPI000823B5BC|nr:MULTISPECIES: tripartite tricarboxylate transporter TctB family protein [unclassified Streptomyces]MYY10725.1 tripartite tricarboxylate transporter TctB family protein [Streptomyces sp. SID4919]SCK62377.1 putative tricarboxylic transport membrane protein [Streptomyces sp. AmelKG-E11A]